MWLRADVRGVSPIYSTIGAVLFRQTVLVPRRIRLNMRNLNALMRTSMRILSFNVPQVKQQMFLFKFADCMCMRTLAVQPANP
jgi:hypothetical protein